MTSLADADIEKALDYLRDNAEEAARARAERIYMDEYRKSIKAMIMKEHGTESGIVQERNAYSDARYLAHLDAIREAVFADERHRFMRGAAEAKIEAWRSQSANYRAMKL